MSCRRLPSIAARISHLPVSAAGLAELAFPSLVDLECAVRADAAEAAHFVVEEHLLA